MSLHHGAVQEPQDYAKLLLPQQCSLPSYQVNGDKNYVYVALTPPCRLSDMFDQMRRSECAACDAADAMFKLDLFLSLLNRALIATVHGKNYRNDIGEDMGPALSMAAYCDGFKSNMQSFLAIGDCEDWMAKFTQLCNTMRDDIVTRLRDMDAQITCEIKGIRIEFIASSGDSLCHTATGVLYCNQRTNSCQLHVVENTDAIAIANNLCPDIAKLFSRVLSHDEAHRRSHPCSISASVLNFLALLQNLTHPNLHRCRKSKTYKLLTPFSQPIHVNFSNSVMQKYELSRQTHKMILVLVIGLCNSLLYNARIGYENTYDMRANLHDLAVQKYELAIETHKMCILLGNGSL